MSLRAKPRNGLAKAEADVQNTKELFNIEQARGGAPSRERRPGISSWLVVLSTSSGGDTETNLKKKLD